MLYSNARAVKAVDENIVPVIADTINTLILQRTDVAEDILDPILEMIADQFEPEEIFSEDQLVVWARAHGFVEEE